MHRPEDHRPVFLVCEPLEVHLDGRTYLTQASHASTSTTEQQGRMAYLLRLSIFRSYEDLYSALTLWRTSPAQASESK